MKKFFFTLGVSLALLLTSLSSAQSVFTITATAETTGLGYTMGNSYTFIFTANSNYTTGEENNFTNDDNKWSNGYQSNDSLWTSVSGTAFSGTFAAPSTDDDEQYTETLRAFGGDSFVGPLSIITDADEDGNRDIGLTTLDATRIASIRANMDGGTLPTFTYSESFTAIDTYFSSFTGSYTSLATTGHSDRNRIRLEHYTGSPTSFIYFTPTAASIAVTAVPEPSTYAVLAGICSLMLVSIRRKRRA